MAETCGEKWLNVQEEDYDKIYEVSNLGQVRRKSTKKILIPSIRACGYLGVSLSKGKRKTFSVHRLVADAHIPNSDNKSVVNHKDGNKQNNRSDNLEWCTHKENAAHALSNSLTKPNKKRVEQWSYDGTRLLATYDSIREAEEKTSVGNRLISQVCRGQKNSAHGFKWEYADDFEEVSRDKVDGVLIPNFPQYIVTREGKIYSIRAKRYLVANTSQEYSRVKLCDNTRSRDYQIHILVAQAYIPNPENKPHVTHINKNRRDNRMENLRWTTTSTRKQLKATIIFIDEDPASPLLGGQDVQTAGITPDTTDTKSLEKSDDGAC